MMCHPFCRLLTWALRGRSRARQTLYCCRP
jgi:hypothetical protein